MNANWLKVNLFYLVLVALLGVLMRSALIGASVPFAYDHVLHAHSHTAFLGWLYQSLFFTIVVLYLSRQQIPRGRYPLQFYLTQGVVFASMLAFLYQGYGGISIALSSAFQLLTYWFIWQFFRDVRAQAPEAPRYSLRFIKVGLLALFVSSLGPWALGAIVATGLADTPWYSAAIYFYLHFQYNGWFIFALLSLLFFVLEKSGARFTTRSAGAFFYLLTGTLFPAYCLSILGLTQHPLVYGLAVLSGAGQVILLLFFGQMLLTHRRHLSAAFPHPWVRALIGISLSAFFLKNLLQFLSVFPPFAAIAFHNRGVIIAFIHLVVLGMISVGLIAILGRVGWFSFERWRSKIGIAIFLTGFTGTEFLLVSPAMGMAGTAHFQWLLWLTAAMAAGLFLFWMGNLFPKRV